jgi:hypothetical protein
MKIIWYIILVSGFFVYEQATTSAQVMPEELVSLAKLKGCEPVNEFFKDRPRMIEPPYVYGYLPGPKKNSAAAWCQEQKDGQRHFFLVFMNKDQGHELAKCPEKIEWKGYPFGLSIFHGGPDETLEKYVYLDDPKRTGPRQRLRNPGIMSSYDGTSIIFYCYQAQWLYRVRH